MLIVETILLIELRSMGIGFQRSRRLGKELLMLFISCFQKIQGGRRTLGGFSLIKSVNKKRRIWRVFFTEDEVHTALMEMNEDKAPGPDGFTMAFWQSCWDFVKRRS